MTAKELPAVDYLRKRLRYEPETGKLFWLDCAEMPSHWRTQFAGKEAFTSVCGGYRTGGIKYSGFRAHRVAWAIHYGEWPSNQIDHINGIRTDNRIENLRVVTPQENSRNIKMFNTNTSGVTGVSWVKARGKWMAMISVKGRNKNLGYFQSIDEATAVRAEASARYGFTKRHGTAI